jgi:multidrug efflux pump subunit AcrA (membrane-fusion protein)
LRRRRILLATVGIAVVGLGAAMAVAVPKLPERGSSVPTGRVAKSPLKLTVHATGDLRAGRTISLVAPPVGGGSLRIVKLVATGGTVKANETVIEFDPSDQQHALEQAKSELAEAEQEIVKMKADAAVQKAQDDVALLTARFDVRRGELDVSGNEFIAALDARKNVLSLEEARRRLAQLEEDVKSRAETNKASLLVVEEKRNKALLATQRVQQVIDSLLLKAPLEGVVSLKENRDAAGGFFFGQALPEYREGDQVGPGRPVADVIESGRMEVRAKVDETDRGNLTQGQAASVYVDALPGRVFKAKVGELAGLANRSFWEASATRLFDVTFQFENPDPRLRAGSSARVVIEGSTLTGALHVPRQAVFARSGKYYVFVRAGERFEEREVKITQRTESRVVIEGLAEGVEVALIDPNARATRTTSPSAPPVPAAGAGK